MFPSFQFNLPLYLHWAWLTAPLWVTVLVLLAFFDTWYNLKRREWIEKQGSILLEIKLPLELSKSPAAMELFLNTLYSPSAGSLTKVYLEGQQRPWFSLELVSINGAVHLYIWCLKGWSKRVETQLYAEFPEIEVHEVPDYTLTVERNPERLVIGWFGQWKLAKADPYPIRTYIDYGLDKDPKEEFKIDPIVPIIEFLGSLKQGEQAWIQILIQAHAKEGLKLGRLIVKPDWRDDIKKEIKKVLKDALLKPDGVDEKSVSGQHLSPGQRTLIESMERTSGKAAFDTMIRSVYFAEKEVFNGVNIGGLIGSLTQLNSPGFNALVPNFSNSFDNPWQDPFGRQKAKREVALLEAYKRRSFFNPPFRHYHGKPFILTTEELATIFHLPGPVASTPTLSRLPSKRAEAPANLPI